MQTEYNPETLRKIKTGAMILCQCGAAHYGKNELCNACLTKTCTNCAKPYIKGGRTICNHCLKRVQRKRGL